MSNDRHQITINRCTLRIAFSAWIGVLFLVLFSASVSGQELVLHTFESDKPDAQLETVLYLAAGVALVHAGLSSTREADSEDYVLSTSYIVDGGRAEISYRLFKSASPANPLAHETIDTPIEIGLDDQVASAMQRLLKLAGITQHPSPQAKIEDLLPESPPASENRIAAKPTVPPTEMPLTPPGPAAGAEALPDNPPPLPETPPAEQSAGEGPSVVSAKAGPPVRFDSSISAAGVLFFGPLTEFVHYGAGGVVSAGLSWPGKSLTAGAAAEASVTRGFNDVNVTGGPLYLFTVGPAFRLGTGTGSSIRLTGGVSAGAALITVAAPAGSLTKTVPFAAATVDAFFPLGGGFSLGGELRFLVVFDRSALIVGASPAVTLRMEL